MLGSKLPHSGLPIGLSGVSCYADCITNYVLGANMKTFAKLTGQLLAGLGTAYLIQLVVQKTGDITPKVKEKITRNKLVAIDSVDDKKTA
jgi:hypothetical protein